MSAKNTQADLILSDKNSGYLGRFKNRKFLEQGHNTDHPGTSHNSDKKKDPLTRALNVAGDFLGVSVKARSKSKPLALGDKKLSGLGPDKKKK